MSSYSPFPEVKPYEPVEVSKVFRCHDTFMIVRPSGNHRVKSADEIDSRSTPMFYNDVFDLRQNGFKVFL